MKCMYCAEEIKDDALLCRFCGAQKVDGAWRHPLAAKAAAGRSDRNITMLTSGWLLVLSGAWMLVSATSPVPLFGAMRGGAVAVLYNGALALAFIAMGYALAARKPWALTATAAATAAYTLDKLLYVMDGAARRASLSEASQYLGMLGDGMDDTVDKVTVLMSLAFLAGWWGLAVYVWIKRAWFAPPAPVPPRPGA